MESINAVIGLVSGLIAIYSFVTGVTALPELRRSSAQQVQNRAAAPRWTRRRLRIRLLVIGPVFAVSLVATLLMGLSGDDAGGIMFLLLALAGLIVLGYRGLFSQLVSTSVVAAGSVVGLPLLGFVFGTIARGEAGAGFVMGALAGLGVAVIIWLTQPGAERVAAARLPQQPMPEAHAVAPRATVAQSDGVPDERAVLELAQRQAGEVRVTDLALQTVLSLDQARDVLESLTQRGFCHKVATDRGGVVYRFPDLL